MIQLRTPFIAHFDAWKGGEVLLILVDDEITQWLMARFEQLTDSAVGSRCPAFVVGNGNPVESDGRCVLIVQLSGRESCNELIRDSQNSWRWSVSRSAANNFRYLLCGMLDFRESLPVLMSAHRSAAGLEGSCHQYLDPDNIPPAPTGVVSRGEYDSEQVRRWAREA
jgi:hypothetical protein